MMENPENGRGETLFIDARKIFTPVDRAHNELSAEQIGANCRNVSLLYPKKKDIPSTRMNLGIAGWSKSQILRKITLF